MRPWNPSHSTPALASSAGGPTTVDRSVCVSLTRLARVIWHRGCRRGGWWLRVCTACVVVLACCGGVARAATPPLVLQGTIGSPGSQPGEFSSLNGVATDPTTGDVYAIDWGNERIQKFSPSGTLISMFGGDVNATTDGDVCTVASGNVCQQGTQGSGPGQFSLIVGLAVSPMNGDVYVVDGSNNRVEVFDSSGNYLSQFGTSGAGNGQFSFPFGVAIDPSSGDLYVTDTGNCRVEEFTPTGQYLSQFGSCGTGNGQFEYPNDVALSPTTGDIYVTDRVNNNVQLFNSSFQYVSTFGTSGAGALNAPNGISVDPTSGDVYVADLGDSNLITYDPSGNYLSTYSPAGSTWVGLAPGPGGVVYAADNSNNVIDILAPAIPAAPALAQNSEMVTDLTTTAATLNASVNAEGNDTTYYFEYVDDTDYNPSSPDPYSAGTQVPIPPGTDIGSNFAFVPASVNISGLSQSTGYHYRVVAINSLGTTYGPDQTFTTYPSAPAIDGESAQPGTPDFTTATLNAEINPDLSDTTYYFEYVDDAGYNPSAPDPYSAGSEIPTAPGTDIGSGVGDQSVTADLTGLTIATTYHYRVVAINAVATTYGPDQTFTTYPSAPAIDSESSSSQTADSASLAAAINPDFADTTYYFEYVDAADYDASAPDPYSAGTQIPLPPGTDIGSSDSDHGASVNLTGLSPATTYHWRVVAVNEIGTTYGADQTFATQTPALPSIDAEGVQGVTGTAATLTAQINPEWDDTTYYFQYVPAAEYDPAASNPYAAGSEIPQPPGTDIGSEDSDQSASVQLNGLAQATLYDYRVVAVNAVGPAYGPDQTFGTVDVVTGGTENVTQTGATLRGTLNPGGLDTVYYFEYGQTTSYGGVAPNGEVDAGSGTSDVQLSEPVTRLRANRTYHYRLAVSRDGGETWFYGADATFTTVPNSPAVETGRPSQAAGGAIALAGSVDPEGAATTYYFEYGRTAGYGSRTAAVSAGEGNVAVPANQSIGTLAPDTVYHFRLVAANPGGTSFGADQAFETGGDGKAMTSVKETPKRGKLAVKPTAPVRHGIAQLSASCTGATGAVCAGTLGLSRQQKVSLTVGGRRKSVLDLIGRATFHLLAGRHAVLRVKLARIAVRDLMGKKSMLRASIAIEQSGVARRAGTLRLESHG